MSQMSSDSHVIIHHVSLERQLGATQTLFHTNVFYSQSWYHTPSTATKLNTWKATSSKERSPKVHNEASFQFRHCHQFLHNIYIPQITFEVITDLSTFLPAAVSTQKYKQVQGKTSLTQDVPTSVSKHACHMLSPSPETGNHSNPDNSLFFKFYLYLFISI